MGLLPEIKEKDANGKILLIYNDIKEITGFPLVNLIFRSMATINGCLETSWFTLRPLYLNQSIQQSASYYFTKNKFEFNDSINLSDLNNRQKLTLNNTLDIYFFLNPVNLIGLYILKYLFEKPKKEISYSVNSIVNKKGHNQKEILPLSDLNKINSRANEALHTLSRKLSNKQPLIIPSLFRHLTEWPALLESLIPILDNLLNSCDFNEQLKLLDDYCYSEAYKFQKNIKLKYTEGSIEGIKNKVNDLCLQFPKNMCIMTLIAYYLKTSIKD